MKGSSDKDRYEPGEPAPDFTLATVQGSYLSSKDVLKDKCATLLVFLRHLG